MSTDPLLRVLARTTVDANECWVSDLGISSGGYSQVNVTITPGVYRLFHAHVLSYERFVGPVPAGLDLDHTCRNRACWNPTHLEPVTRSINVERGAGAAFHRNKTECPRGHEYTPENTRVRPQHNRPGRFRRECRACERIR